MDILILNKAGAEAVRKRYGVYSAIDPVALPDGNFMVPKRCLTDPDLADAIADLNTHTEEENEILDLPAFGEQCLMGIIYKYVDETGTIDDNRSGNVKCVQTHPRTNDPPYEIPALFTFFRSNPDNLALDWIENEWIELEWKRIFDGTTYECIQAHMSVTGQTPDLTPAIFFPEIVQGDPWVQPTGAHDTYSIGDTVTHVGFTWMSDVDNNSWEPGVYGWTQQ